MKGFTSNFTKNIFWKRNGLVMLLLMVGLFIQAQTLALAQSPEEGEVLFQEKACVSCHTIGGGPLVGPDLQGVTIRRDHAWLTRWMLETDTMLAEGDPIALEILAESNNIPMPNSGLSESEVASILAYLEAKDGGGTEAAEEPTESHDVASEAEETVEKPAEAPAPVMPVGDPAIGKALFTGATPLENGGPACMSCHSTTDSGALGGGTLGPDLTNAYTRFGEAGLPATLKGLPFPSMQAVFADKPLSEDEVANLYAYFSQIEQTIEEPGDASKTGINLNFTLSGIAGSIILIVLSQLAWSKRFTGVRRQLVDQ
jgi:mono/diheme cytochrome c family protein